MGHNYYSIQLVRYIILFINAMNAIARSSTDIKAMRHVLITYMIPGIASYLLLVAST